MRFDADARPIPEPKEPWWETLAPVMVFLVIIPLIAASVRWVNEPYSASLSTAIPTTSLEASTSSEIALSGNSFPPEIVEMAVAISTMIAPTPTPTPSPIPPTRIPTVAPEICGTWTANGAICTQPKPPLPTPTPIMACPVNPGMECINTGYWQTSLSPTPISFASGEKR